MSTRGRSPTPVCVSVCMRVSVDNFMLHTVQLTWRISSFAFSLLPPSRSCTAVTQFRGKKTNMKSLWDLNLEAEYITTPSSGSQSHFDSIGGTVCIEYFNPADRGAAHANASPSQSARRSRSLSVCLWPRPDQKRLFCKVSVCAALTESK